MAGMTVRKGSLIKVVVRGGGQEIEGRHGGVMYDNERRDFLVVFVNRDDGTTSPMLIRYDAVETLDVIEEPGGGDREASAPLGGGGSRVDSPGRDSAPSPRAARLNLMTEVVDSAMHDLEEAMQAAKKDPRIAPAFFENFSHAFEFYGLRMFYAMRESLDASDGKRDTPARHEVYDPAGNAKMRIHKIRHLLDSCESLMNEVEGISINAKDDLVEAAEGLSRLLAAYYERMGETGQEERRASGG